MADSPRVEADDFFGNDDDDDDDDGRQLNNFDNRAQAERLRNIAFVEAYDAAKETRLQEGFEAGYRDAFQAAVDLGTAIGSVVSKTADGETVLSNDDMMALSNVRRALTEFEARPTESENAQGVGAGTGHGTGSEDDWTTHVARFEQCKRQMNSNPRTATGSP